MNRKWFRRVYNTFDFLLTIVLIGLFVRNCDHRDFLAAIGNLLMICLYVMQLKVRWFG